MQLTKLFSAQIYLYFFNWHSKITHHMQSLPNAAVSIDIQRINIKTNCTRPNNWLILFFSIQSNRFNYNKNYINSCIKLNIITVIIFKFDLRSCKLSVAMSTPSINIFPVFILPKRNRDS